MPRFRVPEVTVERLSIYLRALKKFSDDRIISSQDLAEIVGTTDAQVRKDFAYFGEFGIPGQGYRVGKLKEEIIHILALDKKWNLALVGVGKLGSALLAYPGFRREEFKIKLAFDVDPGKIGKIIEGVRVEDAKRIPEILSSNQIEVGIITTPAEVAQEIAEKLVEGGVRGILNFAPVRLVIPENIKLKNVDLSMELETLVYFLSR
ncbi:redox-sensing transcriptional repressor Rex [Candidatus Aerophobetes bacterium]|nr:redox-sensing transcriptional repressor Rex [Candidatus Aerophobetes bacterium]